MSTSALAGSVGRDTLVHRRGRLALTAVLVVGVSFVAESVASVFVDSHIGYHAPNAVLNVALLVASTQAALAGRAAVGRAGVIGGWATALMALLAAAGGIWAVAVEGFSSAESPGAVEGIAHTAVLGSVLFLLPLGLGLRHVAKLPGSVIAGSSACLVVMVLVGLDQPEAYLLPEAALGVGWLLLGRVLAASRDRTRH